MRNIFLMQSVSSFWNFEISKFWNFGIGKAWNLIIAIFDTVQSWLCFYVVQRIFFIWLCV